MGAVYTPKMIEIAYHRSSKKEKGQREQKKKEKIGDLSRGGLGKIFGAEEQEKTRVAFDG